MRKHISFGGMTTTTTDHEAHEGDSAIALHLIAEDGAMHPIGQHYASTTPLPTSSRIAAVHRHDTYTHLIIEHTTDDGQCNYYWTDTADTSTLTPLLSSARAANSIAATGHTLCLAFDEGITYCLWQPSKAQYNSLRRDDLLYRLTISQDEQQLRNVTIPIEGTLLQHLDRPDEVQTARPALPARLFEGFYDGDDTYATGASLVAAQMAAAADREAATAGQGFFRHACLGIAALRLHDGTHLLCSNLFGLWPADIDDTMTADREDNTLTWNVWLHRHTVNVEFNHPEVVAHMASGIDIFLSRPQTFLDLHKAIRHTTTAAGYTTSLTFAQLDRQALLHIVDSTQMYWTATIDLAQAGQPVVLAPPSAAAASIDLSDLHRADFGAQIAIGHAGKLSIGHLTPLLHHPLEIAIDYRYGALPVGGLLPDNGGSASGRTAHLVVRATTRDAQIGEVWWQGQVTYPLAGMMMVPGSLLRHLEYHLKVEEGDGTHYYRFGQALDSLTHKGMAVAIYAHTGGVHANTQPLWQSLVVQQARRLTHDTATDTDVVERWLWEEESADDYEAQAAKAHNVWAMTRRPTALRTGIPLRFPDATEVQVGSGSLQALTPHLRRSADGLFGDGQYDAFCSDGIYLLRLSGDRWKAQQLQQRIGMLPGTTPLPIEGGTAFLSARGVMLLKGNEAKCLSECLNGAPMPTDSLPHFDEIVATEPDIAADVLQLPHFTEEFLAGAHLSYDAARQHLWVVNALTDEDGRRRWPIALVYSMRSCSWAIANTQADGATEAGGASYAVIQQQGNAALARIDYHTQGRLPVLLCTRPFALAERHRHATISHLIVRGLFLDRGKEASHIGVALYASNDLQHWRLIGNSAAQYLYRLRGTPYKWFRIVTIGRLLPTESLEGATIC